MPNLNLSDEQRQHPTQVLRSLKIHSGLINAPQDKVTGFVHNRFREYLAASQFADDHDFDLVADRCPHDPWDQVALIVAAQGGYVGQRMVAVLLRAARKPKTARRLKLLTLAAAGYSNKISPADQAKLSTLAETTLPPRTSEEADLLALASPTVMAKLAGLVAGIDAVDDKKGTIAAAMARCARLNGTEIAEPVLTQLAADARRHVCWEVVQALPPEHCAGFWQSLEHIRAPEAVAARITSLEPIRSRLYPQLNLRGLNKITDFSPLSEQAELKDINLSFTNIADIGPLKNLISLGRLDLDSTAVSSITALSHLENLERLDLRSTPVEDFTPLTKLAKLRELYFSPRKIEHIDQVNAIPNLKSLIIGRADFDLFKTTIKNDSLERIVFFGCRFNKLPNLSKLKNLQVLDLAFNQIKNIDAVAGLVSLKTLDISRTNVTDLSPLLQLMAARQRARVKTELTIILPNGKTISLGKDPIPPEYLPA